MSAVCQYPTYAGQQKAPLFDHLIGAGEQRRRHFDAERSRRIDSKQKHAVAANKSQLQINLATKYCVQSQHTPHSAMPLSKSIARWR